MFAAAQYATMDLLVLFMQVACRTDIHHHLGTGPMPYAVVYAYISVVRNKHIRINVTYLSKNAQYKDLIIDCWHVSWNWHTSGRHDWINNFAIFADMCLTLSNIFLIKIQFALFIFLISASQNIWSKCWCQIDVQYTGTWVKLHLAEYSGCNYLPLY